MHRHLAIVRARISRTPPDQRDTEVFDDSSWNNVKRESDYNTDPMTGEYLAKPETVFLNHAAAVHNHNHMTEPGIGDPLNNHMMHLKGPPKSRMPGKEAKSAEDAGKSEGAKKERVFNEYLAPDAGDAGDPVINDHFNQSTVDITGKKNSVKIQKQTKENAVV